MKQVLTAFSNEGMGMRLDMHKAITMRKYDHVVPQYYSNILQQNNKSHFRQGAHSIPTSEIENPNEATR